MEKEGKVDWDMDGAGYSCTLALLFLPLAAL